MITTPEIICDLFSFLDKDQIERIQLVNQFWNNVIIRHKNILPLRQFDTLEFKSIRFNLVIYLYATKEDYCKDFGSASYVINFDGNTVLSLIEGQSPIEGQSLIEGQGSPKNIRVPPYVL